MSTSERLLARLALWQRGDFFMLSPEEAEDLLAPEGVTHVPGYVDCSGGVLGAAVNPQVLTGRRMLSPEEARAALGLDERAAPGLAADADAVDHPPHYTKHPSGVECITVAEHMNFCRGNAVKYIWRAGEKGDEIEDLKKARWYIDREITRLEAAR